MAGHMSPAGSFRAGHRWGKVAGGDVRFTATIVIGRPWEEETVLRLTHAYERATDWHRRRPPLA